MDFLREVNLGNELRLKGTTIVIGGGNVAIDVARTASRVGADKVAMFCLETREQMPALEEEIEETLSEGININNSWGPKRILTSEGRVTGVEFRKCTSVFDASGRFNPVYDENNTLIVDADNVLLSVGQSMDWGNLAVDSRLEFNSNGTVKADAFTYQTAEPDVFAGGDAVTGPRFAIDAIAAGKQGAISIHRYVQPGQSLVIGRDRREYRSLDKDNLELDSYDRQPRQSTPHISGTVSKETFQDLRKTFTLEQVKLETQRCLSCGATVVDEFLCVGCGACTTRCKFDAISLARKYNGEGVSLENLKPVVVKHILKRKGKIAIKKALNIFNK